MDTQFSEKDSLRVINEMISQAKSNFQRGSLTVVLFWGYLISAIAIANFVLLQILNKPQQSFWVWCITLLGLVASMLIQRKADRSAIVKTHIDTIVKYTWFGFGIAVVIFFISLWILRMQFNVPFIFVTITPVIMLMCGMAQFITATACRYKTYYWGAATFWLGALVCVATTVIFKKTDYQFLILAAAMVISFIIPNHILNSKMQKHV